MKILFRWTAAFMIFAGIAVTSCAGHGQKGKDPGVPALKTPAAKTPKKADAKTRPPPAPREAQTTKHAKFPFFPFSSLLPGPSVQVVKVREKDLKELPTGHERALAFENQRKRGFWIFGGPVDFREPTLPEPGSTLDGSLLPPRVP